MNDKMRSALTRASCEITTDIRPTSLGGSPLIRRCEREHQDYGRTGEANGVAVLWRALEIATAGGYEGPNFPLDGRNTGLTVEDVKVMIDDQYEKFAANMRRYLADPGKAMRHVEIEGRPTVRQQCEGEGIDFDEEQQRLSEEIARQKGE